MKATVAAASLVLAGLVCYVPNLGSCGKTATVSDGSLQSKASQGPSAPSEIPAVFKALSGKRVGVVIGSIQDIAITDKAPDADIQRQATEADMFAALENGKVDVAGEGNLAVIFNKELAAKVDTVNAGLPPRPIGAIFHLGNSELQQDFNRFLADIRRDGTYQQIFDRWHDSENPSDIAMPQQRGTGRTLRVATYPAMPPFFSSTVENSRA